jgi:hypothetical protein
MLKILQFFTIIFLQIHFNSEKKKKRLTSKGTFEIAIS